VAQIRNNYPNYVTGIDEIYPNFAMLVACFLKVLLKSVHKYFDMEDKGQHTIIKNGNKKAGVLSRAPADDLYFTPEMVDRIKESQQEIKDGKGIVLRTQEELSTFFDTL